MKFKVPKSQKKAMQKCDSGTDDKNSNIGEEMKIFSQNGSSPYHCHGTNMKCKKKYTRFVLAL